MKRLHLPTTAIAAVLAVLSTAQLPAQSDQLLGITQNIPLLQQHNEVPCQPGGACPLPFPPPPPLAGASAWDATRQQLWVSDGFLQSSWTTNCVPLCPPTPSILPAPVSGMAVFEGGSILFEMDVVGNIAQYQLGCPLIPGPVCTVTPPTPNFVFTALASDDLRQLLFIGGTDPATGVNLILVSTFANPCTPIALYQMGNCPGIPTPFRLLTGLAADACAQTLCATDGVQVQDLNYVIPGPPPTIGFILASCCDMTPFVPAGWDLYAGLAIQPLNAVPSGQPCSPGSCGPCIPQLTELGDPVLGNFAYGIQISNLSQNSGTWLAFNLGPCTPPGVGVIPFCGPIEVPINPSLVIFGPIGTPPGVPLCSGTAFLPSALPLAPNLCGLQVSGQAGSICGPTPFGTFGTAVSNCFTTTLQGL